MKHLLITTLGAIIMTTPAAEAQQPNVESVI